MSPARVRTLSFAFAAVFLLLGDLVLFIIIPVVARSPTTTGSVGASRPRSVLDHRRADPPRPRTVRGRRHHPGARERWPSPRSCAGARLDGRRERDLLLLPRRRRGLRRGAGALRRRPRGARRARSSPCSAPTAPASRRCCKRHHRAGRPDRRRHLLRRARHHPRRRRRRHAKLGIVQVPGGKGVFPTLTVAENLELAAWLLQATTRGTSTRRRRGGARAASRGCASACDQMAGNLSGGEQQMLALAMAFIAKPQAADDRRAVARPGADDRRAAARHRPRASTPQGTTIILVEQSVNVALTARRPRRTSWRRARCASTGRPPSCSSATTSCARCSSKARPSVRRRAEGHVAGRGARRAALRGGGRRACSSAAGSTKQLRRHPGRRRRRPRAARGRDPRAHRAQRRRQDDAVRPHLRLPRARRRAASCSTARRHRRGARTSGPRLGLGRSFQDARLFPSLTVAETSPSRSSATSRCATTSPPRSRLPGGRSSTEDDVARAGRRRSSS